MSTILELSYWPPLAWFALFHTSSSVTLEAEEHYNKGTYRNRCLIAGPNGPQRLSIPLRKGKNQQMPIRDVQIAYEEPWQQVHWRSITAAYGNAPYFEFWSGDFIPFYEKKYVFLFDLNLEILELIIQKTGARTVYAPSESYVPKNPAPPGDFRDVIHPGSDALPDWFVAQPYPQVFSERFGFQPNLSVLDLLFCCGRQSGEILQHSIRHTPNQSAS